MSNKSTEKTYRRLIKRCMEDIARLPRLPENEPVFEKIKGKIAVYAEKIEGEEKRKRVGTITIKPHGN